jgi:hypothetical protein
VHAIGCEVTTKIFSETKKNPPPVVVKTPYNGENPVQFLEIQFCSLLLRINHIAIGFGTLF